MKFLYFLTFLYCKVKGFHTKFNDWAIELVKEMKLLGAIITSDMKWNTSTKCITKKAYSRLWTFRRLKNIGANAMRKKYLMDIANIYEASSNIQQLCGTQASQSQTQQT